MDVFLSRKWRRYSNMPFASIRFERRKDGIKAI